MLMRINYHASELKKIQRLCCKSHSITTEWMQKQPKITNSSSGVYMFRVVFFFVYVWYNSGSFWLPKWW